MLNRFPDFLDLEASWMGSPTSLWPVPMRRFFKIKVWLYFSDHRNYGTGWYGTEVYWVSAIADIGNVLMHRNYGLYTHVQFVISMWTFDMIDQTWMELNHE